LARDAAKAVDLLNEHVRTTGRLARMSDSKIRPAANVAKKAAELHGP